MCKEQLEYWELVLKVIAFFTAALFFLWKLFAGWLIANMDVTLEVKRQIKDAENDWLLITLLLKKGNVDAIWLKDISIRVYNSETLEVKKAFTIDEFKSFEVDSKKITWNESKTKRKYSIATGETFQYGKIIDVPSGIPFIIEARVFGTRILWKGGAQWRSSVAVLPLKENTEKPGSA